MTNLEFAKRLEDLAQVYRNHPNLQQPYEMLTSGLRLMIHDKDAAAEAIRAFGPGDKKDSPGITEWFSTIDYKPVAWRDLKISIVVFKNRVCQRIVTGTRVIPETVIPARPAEPERIVAAHEEPIVEWRCGSLLAPESKDTQETEVNK